MLKVANLTKRFGRVLAVDNLSFEIEKGEIVGFLGPNGAGKTTTMRILSCFLPATGGTVTVAGYDVFSESVEVRRRIGYLPESVPLYGDMRIGEYLTYRARLKGLRGRELRARVTEVMGLCGLTEERRTVIGHLSKGFRQRVGLADSLVHEPDLLILDEPTIGLDPNQIREMRSLIKGLAERHTVFLSSHILSEVELMCRRVLIIDRGRIVAADTPANLTGLMRGNPQVIAEVKAPQKMVVDRVQRLPDVLHVFCEPMDDWCRVRCECRPGSDVRAELSRAIFENQWDLRELVAEKRRLEDVFAAMTRGNGFATED